MLYRLIATLAALMLLFVASVTSAQSAPATEPSATSQPTSVPADGVVARMGDHVLTKAQLDAYQKYVPTPGGTSAAIIDSWKVTTALIDDAREDNILDDPELQAAYDLAKQQILVVLAIRHREMNIKVTDDEIKQFYEKNSDTQRFREPAILNVDLIAADSKEGIDKLIEQIDGGKAFEVVRDENRDQTMKVTGLSDVAFEDVTFTVFREPLGYATAYQLSTVPLDRVMSRRLPRGGWAVFRVTKRRLGDLKPLDDVRGGIESFLLSQKRASIRSEILRKAEQEAGVERKPKPGRPMPKTQSE